MSKRSNQSTAQPATAATAAAALEETRSELQALQHKRQQNREAAHAAIAARDLAQVRKLKVELAQINIEIEAVAAVLEADEEIVADIQRVEVTKEHGEFLHFTVGEVARQFKAGREAYAECMRAIFTAAQFYQRVALAHESARERVRSLRDPRLLEQFETMLGFNNVLPLDHLVRSILMASKGTPDVGGVDYLKVPIADWLKRASGTEQLHLSELERGQRYALDVVARVLTDNSPEAA